MDPPREGAAYGNPREGNDSRGPQLSFDAQGLAMTLIKQRGNHALLRITF
jgi:hypothetical protein